MKLTDIQTHSDYLDLSDVTDLKKWQLHRKRVEFGKQPLTLGMFVPCDENGQPLDEPKSSLIYKMQVGECSADEMRQNREYNNAKERVLFEGYELIYKFPKWQSTLIAKNKDGLGQFDIYDYETIEDLVFINLTLTPNAIKQLGL